MKTRIDYFFKLAAILIIVFINGRLWAQNYYMKTLDLGQTEKGNVYNLSNGDFVVIGDTDDGSNQDMFITRLDNDFNVLFTTVFDQYQSEVMNRLVELDNGGLLITATLNSYNEPLLYHIAPGGTMTIYGYNNAIKHDRKRNVLNSQMGSFIYHYDALEGQLPGSYNRVTISKYDENLTPIWNNYYDHLTTIDDNQGERYVNDMLEDASGNLVILANGTSGGGNGVLPDASTRLLTFDQNGVSGPIYRIDKIQKNTSFTRMCRTDDGGILLCGAMRKGPMIAGSEYDMCIMKVDPSYNVQWAKSLELLGDEKFTGVVGVGNDEYLLSGYISSGGLGGKDACIMKINGSGDIKWFKVYGGQNDEEASLIQKVGSDIYVSGYLESLMCKDGTRDVFLIKTDSSGSLADSCHSDITSSLTFINHSLNTTVLGPYDVGSYSLPVQKNIIPYSLSASTGYGCAPCEYLKDTLLYLDTICLNDTIWFNLKSEWANNFYWDFGDSAYTYGDSIVWHSYSQTGSYDLDIYLSDSTNTCLDTMLATVNVLGLPPINAYSDTTIMYGGTADIGVNGANTYNWFSSYQIGCPDCPQLSVSPDSSTYFYVEGTDSNNCTSLDSVLVNVEFENEIFLPNLFSPNNDGNNDIFYARSFGGYEEFEFSIYNRWGKQVFYTESPNEGWDGTYKGKSQPIDAYVYLVKATSLDGRDFLKQGNVTLVK